MRDYVELTTEEVDDLRTEAHHILNEILDAWCDARMENLEPIHDRYASAQYATVRFWRLYELVLTWAEEMHRGEYIATHHKQIFERCKSYLDAKNFDDYSWMNQAVGRFFNGERPVVPILEELDLDEFLHRSEADHIDWHEVRHIVSEMTVSDLHSNSWVEAIRRTAVLSAFGVKGKLFDAKTSRHGNAEASFAIKSVTCRHILYLKGAGQSKANARIVVGDAIGVSEHALKKWETELRVDRSTEYLLNAAQLAGELRDVFRTCKTMYEVERKLSEKDDLFDEYYGAPFLEAAFLQFQLLEHLQLQDLRHLVRAARERPV